MAMLAAGDPLACPTEAALRHCLSSPRLRRWLAFEFQVSAMDRPWFLRNELVELISALCGGAVVPQRLSRPEWALVRSAFGRPRRLSLQFLKEERVKLEAYRCVLDSVPAGTLVVRAARVFPWDRLFSTGSALSSKSPRVG